jgi:hypothetical protein
MRDQFKLLALIGVLGLMFGACGGDDEDAGTEDAGTEDTGTEDAGTEDAGTEDAGTEDAGTEDAGTEDTGTEDAGMGDMTMGDMGHGDMTMGDMTMGDMTMGDMTMGDMTMGDGACTNADDLATLGSEGYDGALGTVIPFVATSVCLPCLGGPEGCPDGDTIDECVAYYIINYVDGACIDIGCSDDEDAALQTVRDNPVSDACIGCYSGITANVATSACVLPCISDAGGEECSTCQCTEGIVDMFVECSGLPAYQECE